ncbi:ABC transporter substrate-binding protein [Streptomyces sp. TLI_105]|uniref:ABC transporter substrate-binding protein n=1 Tax=Streptomyces sp. TLI_105 TaxID=1881019 RepID=UPI0008985D09|nr:ABC transporter substrate-binding protein [Streptomyces sp. TLI_105]SED14122.1 iron complex transport system substrate-binding protein [Streptomyces sp. TLI_105]
MSGTEGWGFTDDRGTELGAARVPLRVAAYVRAGAALLDLGVTPVAVYGSGHDGEALDPAKSGGLRAAGVSYLGPGRALGEEALSELRPDVIVDVTYDGKSPYALDETVAERLGIPLVALSVGSELTLPAILDRFATLAASLAAEPARSASGAESAVGPVPAVSGAEAAAVPAPAVSGAEPAEPTPAVDLAAAEALLRGVAVRSGVAVLALSGAGAEQVHLARPQAWPELAHLAGLGVRLLDPGPGPGANWLTGDWARVAELRPDLVLFDDREHATPPYELPSGVRLAPWNPETPPSPAAYARFFRDLAEALAAQAP